ncbi:MAG: DUF4493 domain-containing protein [Bacteroidales bacterium]|nr:DUF4493 domain-containing protein [Bacteroidales bacterium]MCB9012457.1 DUF4493 domain-containing protein [Bacteroidales bacterium]
MKKLNFLFYALLCLGIVSCQKDESPSKKDHGFLRIMLGISIQEGPQKNGLKAATQPGDFRVIVYTSGGEKFLEFEKASEMPDSIELEPGRYYVEAHSDNDLPAAFDNPYYHGTSAEFIINSNAEEEVTVICSLANTMVSVFYSDELKSDYSDYTTRVWTQLDTLVFAKDESRSGYFRTLPMGILVSLYYTEPDGSVSLKTLSGNIPDPLPGKHYEIHIHSVIQNGKSVFHVLLDETEIPIELIEISDDPVIPPTSDIAYGELLITELMFDPQALSDTQGEWIEIYNNSERPLSLDGLIIMRDATNSFTLTSGSDLLPGEYFVLAKTAAAVDFSNILVYGSAITLPNTGAQLTLHNKDAGNGPGSIIFSFNYGDANFPALPGASICLDPQKMNVSESILGSSWCLSTSVYFTGDFGTPGNVNDACL